MKVGVYIGEASPESGGGYTFVHDVLQELERLGAGGPHHFTLVTASPVKDHRSPFEVVSLAPAIRQLPARARARLIRSFDQLLGRAPTPSGWTRPAIDRLLAAAQIDVMWYLQPAAC